MTEALELTMMYSDISEIEFAVIKRLEILFYGGMGIFGLKRTEAMIILTSL